MTQTQRIALGCQRRTLVRMMNGRKALMVEPLRFIPLTRNSNGDVRTSKAHV